MLTSTSTQLKSALEDWPKSIDDLGAASAMSYILPSQHIVNSPNVNINPANSTDTGNNLPHIARPQTEIQTAFEMIDMGILSHSLVIKFIFSPDGIRLTQRQYIKSMLADFGLSECRHVATPMVEKMHLLPDMGMPSADSILYQTMVGKLIFLIHTRPDIAYAVSIVSRFMAAPQENHAQAVKHIYRISKKQST
ncbi:hypothetical protein AXG93_146s1240 [Marchantia polymorpha subsp. ruderalis]|uniref:Reverse transcriptase Ty1/copia-type domain-containing protein n=1 Tax=Marchantia polymorpha subsp. ruderalis TaxID=1480154 RepID=A0A176W7I1_MARPO|nr:hypothetical protein AXG93_146s1240 [Marchantia polymorpha subsp. ruderalis]